jgi:hypothetical protein
VRVVVALELEVGKQLQDIDEHLHHQLQQRSSGT